jgi:hypothetical protein
MHKSVILWAFLVGIVTYSGKSLVDSGVFRYIEKNGIEKCRLIVPSDGDN